MSYYGRKEAWSGRNGERTIHYEQNPQKEQIIRHVKIDGTENFGNTGATFRSHTNDETGGPNVIYTKDFIRTNNERNPTMVLEDVEIKPYITKTTTLKTLDDLQRSGIHLNINSDKELDTDSIRRHEIERDSDLNKSFRKTERIHTERDDEYERSGPNVIREYKLILERPDGNINDIQVVGHEGSAREHYYIKDGNAEILRLMSAGNEDEKNELIIKEPEREVIKIDKGKDLIMKKFMEDQKQSSGSTSREEFRQELLRRLQKELDDRNIETPYHPSNILFEKNIKIRGPKMKDMGSNYDYDNSSTSYQYHNQETQSLPGQIEISTQTERDCGTQTEELINLRPPRRKVRSDNEFSDGDGDDDERQNFDEEKAVEALDLGKGWIRRESKSYRTKTVKRHKMRTPIVEEGEVDTLIKYDTRPAMFEMPDAVTNGVGGSVAGYTENKSSILRRRRMKEKILDEKGTGNEDYYSSDDDADHKTTNKTNRRSRRDLSDVKKDADKIPKNLRTESLNRLFEAMQEMGESEFQKIKMETKERAASLNRFYNALENFEAGTVEKDVKKATSLNSLKNDEKNTYDDGSAKEDENVGRTVIVEVQQEKPENEKPKEIHEEEKPKEEDENVEIQTESLTVVNNNNNNSNKSNDESMPESEKSGKTKKSKYMDWYNDLNHKKVKTSRSKRDKKKEDDQDSGITISSLHKHPDHGKKRTKGDVIDGKSKSEQLLEKKSVFTIAYDGVQTKSIRPETNSSENQ